MNITVKIKLNLYAVKTVCTFLHERKTKNKKNATYAAEIKHICGNVHTKLHKINIDGINIQ
jgi:hypothetical protein